MAREDSQAIARCRPWGIIGFNLGRDREINKRDDHNRMIHGPLREARPMSAS